MFLHIILHLVPYKSIFMIKSKEIKVFQKDWNDKMKGENDQRKKGFHILS
jgi:hypothetical protein